MSTSSRDTWAWHHVGGYRELSKVRCRHLYAETGKKWDLAFIFTGDKFHAVEGWCGHMGGPLFQGDIEDYNGSKHVMCPWHGYMFDLKTGKNDIGLEMGVFDVKVDAGQVYVRYHCNLSFTPYATVPQRKNTVTDIAPPQIDRPAVNSAK